MKEDEDNKEGTAQIGIRVETSIKDRLELEAGRRGLPLSGVVRWAILDWLRQQDAVATVSPKA